MHERARGLAMAAAAWSVLDSVGVLGSRAQPEISVALTVALSGGAVWYVCVGAGARVVSSAYAEVLASHPQPPPRIALWAKIVGGLVALLVFASLAFIILGA